MTDPGNEELPPLSTNAPYLVAVWDEVLVAPPPVVGIWSTFPDPGRSIPNNDGPETGKRERKGQDVKIDVVAGGGLSWVRVNTLVSIQDYASFVTNGKQDQELEDPRRVSRDRFVSDRLGR